MRPILSSIVNHEKVGCAFRAVGQEDSGVFHQIVICLVQLVGEPRTISTLTYHFRFQSPDVLHSFGVLLGILNEDIHHHIILSVFRGKVGCLLEVSPLAAHCNCCLQIEFELTWSLNE